MAGAALPRKPRRREREKKAAFHVQPLVRNARVISDRLLQAEGAACSLASRTAKAQVALRTLSLRGEKHMALSSLSPSPAAGPAPYSCRPVLKQTHPWGQLLSSQMITAEQQKAHPKEQGGCKTSSRRSKGATTVLFPPSAAPHKGMKQCEGRQGVPGHLWAQPAPWRLVLGSWVSAASNPSGRERPCAEPQPDPGSER